MCACVHARRHRLQNNRIRSFRVTFNQCQRFHPLNGWIVHTSCLGFKDTLNSLFSSSKVHTHFTLTEKCIQNFFLNELKAYCYPVCKCWQWVCLLVSNLFSLNPKGNKWELIMLVLFTAARVEWGSSEVQLQDHEIGNKAPVFFTQKLYNTRCQLQIQTTSLLYACVYHIQ